MLVKVTSPVMLGLSVCLSFFLTAAIHGPAKPVEQPGIDRPSREFEATTAQLLDCKWQEAIPSLSLSTCLPVTKGVFAKYYRASDSDGIETVVLQFLLKNSTRSPERESDARETALKLVHFLLPQWDDAPNWMARALDFVTETNCDLTAVTSAVDEHHTILLRQVTWLTEREETDALFVITKKRSTDEWRETFDTLGTCP